LALCANARHDLRVEPLRSERVLIARSVLTDPPSRGRLEAMLPFVESSKVEILDDDEVERRISALGPRSGRPRAGLDGRGQPKDLVAFARFGDGPAVREVFPGYSWREIRNGRTQAQQHGVLCQTAIEVQSVVGCPFDCAYCPYTSFVCVRLDVETFVDRVEALVKSRPSQTLWKLNNRSDTLALEPEYGLSAALVQRFARLGGPTLLLYSKGDRVEHLVDLDHAGRTAASFTLTPEPIADLLEQGAPSPASRIEALGALHRAGYPVRVRFSPIVPFAGYRDAYDDLARRIARAGSPELFTFWTLSMIELDELPRIVPLGMLDSGALDAARAAAKSLRGDKGAPFPEHTRARIYSEISAIVRAHLPESRVSLCLESPEVWDALGASLPARSPGGFVCNCGPRATPQLIRLSAERDA
jgi:spore photoproduct lyase